MTVRTLTALTLVAVLIATAASAPAADPARAQQEPPLPCDVTYDRTVAPLDVIEDQTVHVDITVNGRCSGEKLGLDTFFVVDRTDTMFDPVNRPRMINAAKDALKYFVNAMNFNKSLAGIVSYGRQYSVERPLTDDQDAIVGAIENIRHRRETDVRGLKSAFRYATQHLQDDGDPNNEKVIFIVTGGPDMQEALLDMPSVARAAHNAGIKVVFLMFASRTTNSAYGHYVDAATDCTWTKCPIWGGASAGSATRQKYAWRVSNGDPQYGTPIAEVMR